MTKHYTKKSILLLSLLFLGFSVAFAQGDVTGKVTDELDGQPFAGVTVLVKGTMTGTTTDMDGKYRIRVKAGDFLVFSFIGYETQEIGVQPNTVVNVSMAMKAEFLGRTGYHRIRCAEKGRRHRFRCGHRHQRL